jgi:hypothetical protein
VLVIRQEQLDALIKGTDDEWVETLVGQVSEEDPDISKKYDDDALRSMVRVAIKKAERYGFTAADDQASFVSTMFEVAPNFDEQEEIRAVLLEDDLKPSYRLEKLFSNAVPEEAWDKAEQNYNEEAWKEA